jgi:uncharacterized iron-regulated protein
MFYRFLFIFSLFALLFYPAVIIAEERTSIAEGEYNLKVSFDIPNSKITGRAKIFAQKDRELIFHTGRLAIRDVRLNGDKIEFDAHHGALKILPPRDGIVEIIYEGIFKEGGQARNIIDERGISLTGIWYPYMPGLFKYSLSAFLPEGYEAVSEAERIEKTVRNGVAEFFFDFPHPVDGINFIATNRWEIIKDYYENTEIYAYFFPEDMGLARKYIEYTKKYLKLYEDMLGEYPYKRFSIVTNFLPTGYSMPTFTLLGQNVIRLPFIVEISLGHEILHQWLGNLVYVDYNKGNWSEGITTYLADHLYEELEGKGWQYRKQMLINYRSYVHDKNEFPLRDFRARVDFPSSAIGYGKAMMVFHMLKEMVGEDIFYKSVRNFIDENRFRKTSWDDIKKAFEANYGKDLNWFFEQWVDKKGLPDLNVENVKIRQRGSKYEISFDITQKREIRVVDVPVTFYFLGGGTKRDIFRIDGERHSFNILMDEIVEKLVMDEDYDVARIISDKEFPPVIARLLGDEDSIIAVSGEDMKIFSPVIDIFKRRGAVVRELNEVRHDIIKESSLIIPVISGSFNPLIARLYGSIDIPEGGFGIIVRKNPWNADKVVGIIFAKSKEEVNAAARRILHYGKYSTLSFERGRNILKEIEKTDRGIKMAVWDEPLAISATTSLSAVRRLSDVIREVADKRIVYVGEVHDRFAHHAVQLLIIRELYEKNKNIAIGMEMFQRPFQKALDDYIAGRIDEREFLKKTEYFKRWGFDYNLYKPILDFAKEKGLPVVALNVRREILKKVSSGGIDSLSLEEMKEIPLEMDFSDDEYREWLKKVFKAHNRPDNRGFDFFLQSQLLWDETMAMSIYEFMKNNPDYQMVVIAGGGHLKHGWGIPSRVFRRNGYDYAIILNDANIEENIADYIIFPKPLEGITAPKLMVLLTEEAGRVKITGFPENSISKKAGLQERDIIVSLDGIAVSSIDDIRIHLTFKEKGESVTVKVLRNRFLVGEREMEFEVVL